MRGITADSIIRFLSSQVRYAGSRDRKTNLIFQRRLFNTPDRTYQHEKNYDPVYKNYDMFCLPIHKLSTTDITEIGVDCSNAYKCYITSDQFSKYYTDSDKFYPRKSDRVIYRGVIFEIIQYKPIILGDTDIIYCLIITEASLPVQTEEYRERIDPYFEYDMTQEEQSTNDTGSNKNLFIDNPVQITCDHILPTSVWETDNTIVYTYDTEDKITYSIPTGVYTVDSLVLAFSTPGIKLVVVDNELQLQSINIGKNAKVEIFYTDNNMYSILGISPGIYYGTEELRL